MSVEVIWSDEARQTYFENLEYLKYEWDEQVASDFIERVEEIQLLIRDNPKLFPPYQGKENIRRCVLNKHLSMFYSIESQDRIGLITFWNTHQSPDNLKL